MNSEEAERHFMKWRLYDVGFPILREAAEWCPFEQELIYGLILDGSPVFHRAKENAVRQVLIGYVHPLLPAGTAGLRAGTTVLKVNEQDMNQKSAEEASELIKRATAAKIQPLELNVHDGVSLHTAELFAVPACNYSFHLVETDILNATATGRQVIVSTGLMRVIASHDELAWVLAHEIAHNVLQHSQNVKLDALLETFLQRTLGEVSLPVHSPPRWKLEQQADYVALYLMARAGYDLEAVGDFWNRLVEPSQTSSAEEFSRTHPTKPERLATFQRTKKEILAKIHAGQPLRPEPFSEERSSATPGLFRLNERR